MYLRIIFEIEESNLSARITDISKKLGIAPASATEMIDKLKSEKLVTHKPYGAIMLTAKGTKSAKKIVTKHRLIEIFLRKVLMVKSPKADACNMEHAISDEAAFRLCIILGCPSKSIGGKPIYHLKKHKNIPSALKKFDASEKIRNY